MGLKPKHTPASVQAEFDRRMALIERYVIQQLAILGVKAVNHARQNRGYTDRTGNLVNSTGMVIVRNGKIVFEDYKTTFRGGKKKATANLTDEEAANAQKDGITESKKLLQGIAAEFSRYHGYALIIGAGMEYASTVEKYRGKNVLAATELYLRDEFPKVLAQIKTDIRNMKV